VWKKTVFPSKGLFEKGPPPKAAPKRKGTLDPKWEKKKACLPQGRRDGESVRYKLAMGKSPPPPQRGRKNAQNGNLENCAPDNLQLKRVA